MADKHKIVFYGEILEGQNLETVKKNLGALFKMDNDKIDRLLSKPSVLIKKDIDLPTASKYQELLKKAGAICKIEPMNTEPDIFVQKKEPVPDQPDENQGTYEVIFYGELEEGQDFSTVKKRLSELFNKDLFKIEEFLSHIPAIIKKNVDLDTALKYRETLQNAGAVCLIKPVKEIQTVNQVSPEPKSEKIQADPFVSSFETQMHNEPSTAPAVNVQPSSELAVNEQPFPEHIVNEPVSPESNIMDKDLSKPSCHLTCPQCNFKQEFSDKCVRCGFVLRNCPETAPQSLSEQDNKPEKSTLEGAADRSKEDVSGQHSVNFFKRLFHLTKEEKKEILRLIIGSAFIGAVVGFMWGGLYDPWQTKGISAAWLNFLLFGGWGLAEVAGVVAARNLRYVKGRIRLVFNGALWGGIWVGLFTALEMVKNVSSLESIFLNIIIGLFAGFIIGGLISAICSINLSSIMTLREEKTLTI